MEQGFFFNRYIITVSNESYIRRLCRVIGDTGERLVLFHVANRWVNFVQYDKINGLYLLDSVQEDNLIKLILPQCHTKNVFCAYVNEIGFHREDGPALTYTENNNLVKTYALNNIVYTPEEYLEALPDDKKEAMLFRLNELRS